MAIPEMEAGGGAEVLSIINPTPIRLPGPSLLHELIQNESRQYAPAIDFLSQQRTRHSLSYRELHDKADSLARRIAASIARDAPRRDGEQFIVPVLIPQCPGLYISQLAILKAGGAFCSLNLDAPPERVKFVLSDTSARVVLTTTDLATRIPAGDGRDVKIVVVDSPEESFDTDTISVDSRPPRPSDLAYVMYTSGSTGTPKGVGISHDAATQSLLAHDQHIPFFNRFLQFAAPTFDVSVFEIFFPLLRGATLVCCDRAAMLDDLPAVLTEMDVDACELTPTVAGSLLRKRENAPSLQLLLTIGEMLTGPVVQEFGGRDGKDRRDSILWAMYGPTEATIHCTLQPAFRSDSTVNNIGIPLSTVSAFVLAIPDEAADITFPAIPAKEPTILPIGEVGELAVGGFQLAEGYINRPEQTAASFIHTATHGRLYRTGDKARLRPDGVLECLGRISEGQVKLRGQRIELGEVEAAVLRVEGCHGAVAAVIGGSNLVVFCTVDQGLRGKDETSTTADSDRVLENCTAWLPRFMLPNDVVILDELPQLPSGKVDRKRLVADYKAAIDRATSASGEDSFRDELEKELCAMARQVLNADLTPLSKLASLGMDSIVAIRFASLVRQRGLDVSTLDVLSSRTVRHLHSVISHRKNGEGPTTGPAQAVDSPAIDIQQVIGRLPLDQAQGMDSAGIEAILPCTPLQESMLAETARSPQANCNWIDLQFPVDCDPEKALAAFQELAQAHEILRTGFTHLDGRFVQVIWERLPTRSISAVNEAGTPSTFTLDLRELRLESDEDFLRPLSLQIKPTARGPRARVAMHHAIYDGWSTDLLLADIDLLLQGTQIAPRPQFRAVSAYYHASKAYEDAADDARAFWAEQLLGYQPPSFPQVQTTTAQNKGPQTLSSEFVFEVSSDKLRQISNQTECGTQVFFQACVTWLWSAIIGVDDVVIGNVTSGRTIPVRDVEQIVGPCMASVPLRAKLRGLQSIRELLGYLQAANRAILPHSVLPLAEIKKTAGLLPAQTLYDVLFVYQESLLSRLGGERLVRLVDHQDYLETKILVEVEPRSTDFLCRITYHAEDVPSDFVLLLGAQLQSLFRNLTENLDGEVDSLWRCGLPEQILSAHNTSPATFQGCPDLARLVELTTERSPEKPAVCFATSISEGSMSSRTIFYSELNSLANQIGYCIRSLGAETGSVVAIIMDKSVELYAGILGILKAGCTYLPLLPSTPLARIELILQQAGVQLSLCDSAVEKRLEGHGLPRMLNILDADLPSYPDSNLGISPDPLRVANVIYTSGTTGVPKGVCVTQLNVASNLDVLSRIYPIHDGSRLLQSCSQAFDVSVFEIFFAWTTGMCLCSAANDTLFEDLERAIRTLGITHLSMTPTVAALVDPRNVPGVEFLVTSGEPMTQAVANKWTGLLFQGYGPSETTNICTVKMMAPGDVIQHLGFDFENTSSVVLHRDAASDIVVPRGCLGELCFGGDQVVQGYLGMPDLTAEKFITHPQHGRLYRSGDLGRMLPDGSLMIVGRADDQIKLRGQRIELREIEAVARGCDGVTAAITLVVSRGGSGPDTAKQLAAFFVPAEPYHTEDLVIRPLEFNLHSLVETLRVELSSRLPVYMVPDHLVPINAIPLTASGKADKDRLRGALAALSQEDLEAFSSAATSSAGNDDEEWSATELAIAQVLAKTVRVEEQTIGRWTPFASLGLDSISAIAVARQLRDGLGVRIPISRILQTSCVTRLAQAIATIMPEETASLSSPLDLQVFTSDFITEVKSRFASVQGLQVEAVLPCTPLQEAMLAASHGSHSSYLNQMVFKIIVDLEKMRWCWEQMVTRHPILRTCFVTTDQPRHPIAQIVLEGWLPAWQSFEVESVQNLDQYLGISHQDISSPLDSPRPPVALTNVRSATGEGHLVFSCHHALYDGVAVGRLLEEVETLMRGATLFQPPPYGPFLQEMLDLPASTDDFWKSHLEGFSPALLPSEPIEVIELDKSQELSAELLLDLPLDDVTNRLRELGISLLAVCQASWAVTLATLVQGQDVCFGNVVSGRSISAERIDELVAPCFNTIPVRVDLSAAASSIDLAKTVQKRSAESLQYQFTPLRRIQGQALRENGSGRLFDTLLLLQQPPRPLDSSIWTLERDEGAMDLPLVCEVTPDPQQNRIVLKIHRDAQHVSSRLAAFVLRLFPEVLEHALNRPSAPLPSQSTLSAKLREELGALSLHQRKFSSTTTKSASSNADTNWTDSENAIRLVFAALSSAPEAGIRHQTTIYQLGLDSISAVLIAASLRKQGFEVSSSDVMEHPTCAALARFLDDKHSDAQEPDSSYDFGSFADHYSRSNSARNSLVPRDAIEAILPCTPLQQGMLSEFLSSQGHNYFNFVELRLATGEQHTQLTGLEEAWSIVAAHHEMLRTGFAPVEHKDASFAMLRYHTSAAPDSVMVFPHDKSAGFHLDEWRSETRRECLEALHQPAWRVALVETELGISMHLAIHHALYDAQSLQIILHDLATAVGGAQVAPHARIEGAVSYLLQKSTSGLDEAEQFWKDFAPVVAVNNFPTMTPLQVEHRQILVESAASKLPFSSLELAAKSLGCSIQAIIQAAWTRLLCAYLGEAACVFGVVMSGRDSDVTQETPFPCITTIPVVAQNKSSNRELVDDMVALNAKLRRHQHMPLAQIQKWLGYPDSRVFDTLLVYQKLSTSSAAGQDSRPWEVVDDCATIDYPVSLEVEPLEDVLHYRITFFDDVLPSEQAKVLLDQFDAMVRHIALRPDACQDDLWMDDPLHYSIFPAEQPEMPTEVTLLHQFLETKAREFPDRVALEFVSTFHGEEPVEHHWTYRELDNNGNKVANTLAPHTKTGGIVAVYFDKCPEAYFAILGILKAGCAFVALDPKAPPARRQFILEDSGASALVTDPATARSLDFVAAVPVIELDQTTIATASSSFLQGRADELSPQDRCYCLYTSGTTGTPKGCEITHENSVQAMLAFQHLFSGRWDDNSKWLQFASFHFDVSVLEQYWSWSVGITLVSAPRDLILEDLEATISRLGITHIDLTPSLARLVHPDEVPSLSRSHGVFITGGEQLKKEILDVWGQHGVIHNAYGPTEATIGVTMYCGVPANGRAANIGRQFPNVGSYIFKPGTEIPVVRGGVGELCLSGKLVGKGYLNRPELTEERFPTLKHEALGHKRVYRTGDLVRVLHNGCFDFLGRADDQVKLRGQRLEIGEINHAIRSGLPDAVEDVATLVIRDEKRSKDFLVSFVVARGVADTTTSRDNDNLEVVTAESALMLSRDVQEACRTKLPGYMVPTYVLQLPFIPLSSNNKAEVRELRRLFSSLTQEQLVAVSAIPSRGASLSGNVARRVIAALRAMQLLPEDDCDNQQEHQLNATTSIFELGIDSISAIRLSRALRRGGLDHATPSLILKHPVLGDLVRVLQTQASAKDAGSALEARQLVEACQHRNRAMVCRTLGISSDHIEYIAPCSALQHGMISRSKTEEHAGAYFNIFTFELSRDVNVARLRAAWRTIVDSFSILRTCFIGSTEGFVQVALREMPLPWEEMIISSEGADQDDSRVDRILREQVGRWLDSNEKDVTSPLELLLATLPDGRRLLRLHIFHGLYDANSLGMIIAKSAALYLGTEGIESRTTFIDALIHGPLRNYSHTKEFWMKHLHGGGGDTNVPVQPQPLPQLSPQPSIGDISISRTLDFKDMGPVRRSLNVTHSALIQALWMSVLRARHPREDGTALTVGVIVFGRAIDVENAEQVVGPLFNTLPFRLPDSGTDEDETWASLALRCHEFQTETLPFQHTPLRDVQRWCSGGRPLFDSLFSCQRESMPSTTAELWTEVPTPITADYPLAFEATLTRDDKVEILLVAQSGVADETVLSSMLDGFEASMTAMTVNLDARVTVPAHDSSVATPSVVRFESTTGTTSGTITPRPLLGMRRTSGSGPSTPSSFEWTEDALAFRVEIASLAAVAPETVDERTGLLELGLDSIDTIKLSARLRKRGIAIANSQLIRGQCILRFMRMMNRIENQARPARSGQTEAEMAGETNEASAALQKVTEISTAIKYILGQQPSGMPFGLDEAEAMLPPAPLQDAMAADMVQSGFRRYFNHDVLELGADVDIARLRDAWQVVVDGSSILRTVFVPIHTTDFDFAYCQVVKRELQVPWKEVWVTGMQGMAGELENIRQRAEEGAGAADIFQLTIVHVGDDHVQDKRLLILSVAHALYDGWSLGLLHADIRAAYDGVYKARPSYLGYLGHILGSATPPEAYEFWSDSLTGSAPALIPPRRLADRATSSTIDTEGRRHSKGFASESSPRRLMHRAETVSSISASRLLALCRRLAASAQVVGQVCWAAALSQHVQSLDVAFGSVLSGRETEDAESLLFPTMNTVTVRAVLHGTVESLLRYAQENMAGATQFLHFPLRKALKLIGGGVEGGALFNSLFIMQKRGAAVDGEGEQPTSLVMRSVDGDSAVEYPVCVEMEIIGSDVVWRTACDDAFLTHDDTQRLLRDLDAALTFLVESPPDSSIFGQRHAGGDEISVCGLPPFRPRPSSTVTEVSTQTDGLTLVDDELQEEDESSQDWTPLEERIRAVLAYASGFKLDAVKRAHTLYNLGLDSISAIKVSALLRRTGVHLKVRDLLKAESLADMALLATVPDSSLGGRGAPEKKKQRLEPHMASPATALEKALKPINVQRLLGTVGLAADQVEMLLPASPMQVHMLSVWQKSDGEVFFPVFRYEASGMPSSSGDSISTLRSAWTALMREVPLLRTIFLASGDREVPFLQVVLNANEDYASATFCSPSSPRSPATSTTLISPMVRLQADPLDSGADGWALTLRIHHSLYDGVSLPMLMSRFAQLLVVNGKPQSPTQSSTHDAWMTRLVGRYVPGSLENRKSFWSRYLEGGTSTPFRLPGAAKATSPTVPDAAGRSSTFVPHAVPDMSRLRAVAADHGISVQACFLAAVASYLSDLRREGDRSEEKRDVVFGVYLANRDSSDDGLDLYPTMALVPLRARPTPHGEDLLDFVRVAREIQRDLRDISSAANACAALWEIEAWTGIKVDCFVNFLSLPTSSTTDSKGEEGASPAVASALKLKEIVDHTVAVDSGAGVLDSFPAPLPSDFPWLQPNRVADAFSDAVDIEAALNSQGGLDIGVFGPKSKLPGGGQDRADDAGQEVIASLVERLRVVGKMER